MYSIITPHSHYPPPNIVKPHPLSDDDKKILLNHKLVIKVVIIENLN